MNNIYEIKRGYNGEYIDLPNEITPLAVTGSWNPPVALVNSHNEVIDIIDPSVKRVYINRDRNGEPIGYIDLDAIKNIVWC